MPCRLTTTRRMTSGVLSIAIGLSCLTVTAECWGEPDSSAPQLARQLLTESGVRGGIVVHLGCGDGKLTAALGIDPTFTVQGLALDVANVALARQHVAQSVDYGRVSIERLQGATLPYADNLINLVVVQSQGSVPSEEIQRVLAPQGVACIQEEGQWRTTQKKKPGDIDEWSHFLHDAGNNAVARDSVVGPPRSIQWIAPPLWLRSHETPSGLEGMVSSGGRVFYFFDEGPIGITDQRFPERWSLICRDAFNGRRLWQRSLEGWGWSAWASERFADKDWTTLRGGRTVVPDENQRRLVADGDRLYVTLGYVAPLSILDASTGEVLATVPETEPVREILASQGTVLVHSRDTLAPAARRRGQQKQVPSILTAVSSATGEVRWTRETRPIDNLLLAVDDGLVFYRSGPQLCCLELASGHPQWQDDSLQAKGRTLVAHDGVVLVYAGKTVEARDGRTGQLLWRQQVPPSSGGESPDLFVANGVVWRGMVAVNEDLKPIGKSEDAMAIGFDLRTGDERRRIVVHQLRSPEHHHRCYRNKATERFIISGMEGAEFMDLQGDDHGQHNWLRGSCKLGVMPCNGLLYVPPDQCFCQPGAKILGFAAVAGHRPARENSVSDSLRLEKGPAFGAVDEQTEPPSPEDWPTYRYDVARHGSTPTSVTPELSSRWRTAIGGRLTAPVAVDGRVYVAACDAHTVHALDTVSGERLWQYAAAGRVDSPPTVDRGLVLFGSADGSVYCLRAADGVLVWRFLAAPNDVRIGSFDQIESVWPVHGSVLVRDGIVYATAGRSTYLDGGIRVYGLDPRTGKLLHHTTLTGPMPEINTSRDEAFYLPGANSDVLVSEGEHLYMRQKKLTPDLQEVELPVLSSKGEHDVGLHLFSTAGLLDGSWYNRAFWMYSQRWPGFQLANQAPKSGQLLVVDDERTYGVKVFYRRNVHSPMFFPAREGYLLFADDNANEPQIVGESGSREPVAWLPQSDYLRGRGDEVRRLDSPAFGLDKMIGYTRAVPPQWTSWVPVRARAMVKTKDCLFLAGPPDELDPADPYAAIEGRQGARLVALAAADGVTLASHDLDVPPVFDGLIAARQQLFVSLQDGSLMCLGGESIGKP